MKSPFTDNDNEVSLRTKKTVLNFRGEKFTINHQYYYCKDTKQEFTTTELDEINLDQVYNQYKKKYPDFVKPSDAKG